MLSKLFVTETSLNYDHFHCCGDEDLYPFKCSQCGHIMVFCYECDTLYPDLSDPSQHHPCTLSPGEPVFSCPSCSHPFEVHFMQNNEYKVSIHEWLNAGFQQLLSSDSLPAKDEHLN